MVQSNQQAFQTQSVNQLRENRVLLAFDSHKQCILAIKLKIYSTLLWIQWLEILLEESPVIHLFLHTQANAQPNSCLSRVSSRFVQRSCYKLLLLKEENINRKLHPCHRNSFTSGPDPQVTTLLATNTISSLKRMTVMTYEMLTSDITKKGRNWKLENI